MNDSVLTFLRTRKSALLPTLGEPGPDADQIGAMLEIAARVPDHGVLAPWRFVLYRGDARIAVGEALAALQQRRNGPLDPIALKKELARFSRAPLVVGVLSAPKNEPKVPEWEQFLSAGAAAMNLVHAASALGFGANWVTGWYADDVEASRMLGAGEGERFVGFVHVGSLKAETPDRPRPDWRPLVSDWVAPV